MLVSTSLGFCLDGLLGAILPSAAFDILALTCVEMNDKICGYSSKSFRRTMSMREDWRGKGLWVILP